MGEHGDGDGGGREDGDGGREDERGRTQGPARAARASWRPGAGAWLMGALFVLLLAGVLVDDLGGSPPWWRVAAQTLGLLGTGSVALRMLGWRITATPEGLRVRTLAGVRLVPWDETSAAVAVGGGTLSLLGACGGRSTESTESTEPAETAESTEPAGPAKTTENVVIDYTGFRRPHRLAAEIGAMIADPALRPVA
ncbi:hypothetical protein [Actinacidiphila rubida]|uniref:PH domain-containing protein n=1 Tax=Actinacidiphila rubida TaxID=310780 RepID=A0A1H8Q3X0_9ACTN|nr:hypothetical protein [Actinacidiphila rubida]SEO48900.1 hypothetical protein SAMN05216267_102823 [Actinacidiphila rubida]